MASEKVIRRQGNWKVVEYTSSLDGTKVYYLYLLPYYQLMQTFHNKAKAIKEFNNMLKSTL